jgi:hypothetical protein
MNCLGKPFLVHSIISWRSLASALGWRTGGYRVHPLAQLHQTQGCNPSALTEPRPPTVFPLQYCPLLTNNGEAI